MAKKRLNQLRVKGPTTDAVKKSVTEELNRQQKDKTKHVKCGQIIDVVLQKEETDEDMVVNAIKELANSNHVMLGKFCFDENNGRMKNEMKNKKMFHSLREFRKLNILLVNKVTFQG